jgi:serine/threonine protein kinase
MVLKLLKILEAMHSRKLVFKNINPSVIIINSDMNPVVLLTELHLIDITNNYNNPSVYSYSTPESFVIDYFYSDTINKMRPIRLSRDVYQVGILISEMFSGVKPWTNIDKKISNLFIVNQHRKKCNFPIPNELDKTLKHIIQSCTKIVPGERPTIAELYKIFYVTYKEGLILVCFALKYNLRKLYTKKYILETLLKFII